MGNAASRQAAKQVQKASGNGAKAAGGKAPPPRPPPLGRMHANTPDQTEDAEQALKQRQNRETMELSKPEAAKNAMQPATARPPQRPPQPDANSGFFRGQISDPRDVAQEKFLIHQSGAKNELEQQQQQEIAPDLLKFLTDAGPLEKKVNKKMTSPRVVKEMEEKGGVESEKMHRFEAAERTRDDMRLVEGIEGYSTPRTTNYFTSSALTAEEEKDFGLTDLELYDLLKRHQSALAETEAGQQGAELTKTFHAEKMVDTVEWTNEEQQEQQKLLNDAMNALALPVVVKDTDQSYIGLHQKELDKEFAHQKIDVVDESRVKLVLADLIDLGRKEIRRIR